MGVLGQKLISIRSHLTGKCLHTWFRWKKWYPLSEWISKPLTHAKDFLLKSVKHFGIHLCQCLSLFCWAWRLLLGIFFFPLNALDHSSYICLQHYLLSLLTHWDLQLGCRVYIIIMVGKTLSAAMSTAENHCKFKCLVRHAQVSEFCSSRNCARLCCPETTRSSWESTLNLEPYVSCARQCDPQTSPSPRARKRCPIYSSHYRNKDVSPD